MTHNMQKTNRRCSRCGRVILEKTVPASPNAEGYTQTRVTECPGGAKEDCKGWIRVFFVGQPQARKG